MRKLLITAFTLIFSLESVFVNAEASNTNTNDNFAKALRELIAEDEISVMSEDEFSSKRLVALADEDFDYMGADTVITDSDGLYVLKYSSPEKAEAAYEYYLTLDDVSAAPDITLHTADDDSEESSHLSWGADYISIDSICSAVIDKYGSADNAPTVNVAIIDSGVDYTHSFLADRVDYDKGYDYVNADSDAMDDAGHGTHVAGIICDNSLSNVRIIPIKVMDSGGSGTVSSMVSGIKYAKSKGADIINMSIGGSDSNQAAKAAYKSIFDELADDGIIVTVAAGNIKTNAKYYFPANIESNFTVSAFDSSGSFASSYSNYGSVIDICAPGSSIYSTLIGDTYGYKTGTSMACPFVSAAAAMVKTLYYDEEYTPEEITALLEDAALEGEDEYYCGAGLLNLAAFGNTSEDEPTATPTASPTIEPTATPTASPTATPTASPTIEPTATPTVEPTALPVPEGLTAENITESSFTVTWTACEDEDITEYIVAVYCDGILIKTASITDGTSCTVSGLDSETEYTVNVQSSDGVSYSEPASINVVTASFATAEPTATAEPALDPTASPTVEPTAAPTDIPSEEEYAYTIDDIEAGDNSVTVTVTDNFGNGEGVLIIAAYNDEGQLISIRMSSMEGLEGGTAYIREDGISGKYISAFVWSSTQDMIPMSLKRSL